jgi:hypothetical protein
MDSDRTPLLHGAPLAPTDMPRWHTRLVTIGLAGFIGIHAAETYRSTEHWPFCSYPMYSGVQHEADGVTSTRVVGVLASGEEVRLQSAALLFPFDQARIANAFDAMQRGADPERRSQTALRGVLSTYEARRRAGHHDGPALRGMRLYWTKHRLDPDARNLAHPDERVLLAEVDGAP